MDGRRRRFETVPGLVLILVPTENAPPEHVLPAARVAMLHALGQEFHPVNPVLHYGPVVPYEDITSKRFLPRLLWWWERCERIWLCAFDGRTDLDDVALDANCHAVLMRNELVRPRGDAPMLPRHYKDPVRKPVSVLSWGSGDDLNLRVLSRKELSYMLQANVVTGLLRGVI